MALALVCTMFQNYPRNIVGALVVPSKPFSARQEVATSIIHPLIVRPLILLLHERRRRRRQGRGSGRKTHKLLKLTPQTDSFLKISNSISISPCRAEFHSSSGCVGHSQLGPRECTHEAQTAHRRRRGRGGRMRRAVQPETKRDA